MLEASHLLLEVLHVASEASSRVEELELLGTMLDLLLLLLNTLASRTDPKLKFLAGLQVCLLPETMTLLATGSHAIRRGLLEAVILRSEILATVQIALGSAVFFFLSHEVVYLL